MTTHWVEEIVIKRGTIHDPELEMTLLQLSEQLLAT